MKPVFVAVCIVTSLASHAIGYVGAGLMEPIPPLTLEELGVSRKDHELAKQWTEARRGHYQNEITREEWIRDKLLSRRIVELGPQRWVVACMSVGLTESNPRPSPTTVGFSRDPNTLPTRNECCRALARHLITWASTAPYNHPLPSGFSAVASLEYLGDETDRALMDALQSTLVERCNDVPSGFNQLQRKQWQESFEKTLAAFVEARKRAQQQQMWQLPPLISHGGDFMAHFKSYADSHWIIGEGVAFDLKPAEISRLREEGRLYDPDDLPPPAPVDDRTWIVISCLAGLAMIFTFWVARRALHGKPASS